MRQTVIDKIVSVFHKLIAKVRFDHNEDLLETKDKKNYKMLPVNFSLLEVHCS